MPYHKGDEKQIKKEIEPPLYIPEEIKKLNILIVDDEEYNRLLFKTILGRWKVKFNEVTNGMEALELLKTDRFDLLFMDARMPGLDGLKTTQFIRNEMKIRESEMPVICISAATVSDDWPKYEKAGINAFLPKPFTEEMLLTTILSVIRDYAQVTETDTDGKKEPANIPDSKIDLHNLYHISGGDEKFVKQMLLSFVETTEKGLKVMQEAVISSQMQTAAEIAHKLSPPCRHIGAVHLCNYLKEIENNIRNNNLNGSVEKLTLEACAEFAVVREVLKSHIGKIS
jgi:CheY-like chemotaxis protein/HPt (histidine-containing phosphotransfer) domain-containing protein